MTTATAILEPSKDFFDGVGGILTAIFSGLGTLLAALAAAFAGMNKKSSKNSGVNIQAALEKVAESNRVIVSRLDGFEARTTARLDRLETDVAGLRDLQRMEADLRIALERIEHLKSDVERLSKAT